MDTSNYYRVKLHGTSYLIHNRFPIEDHISTGKLNKTKKKKEYDPKEEAEKALYRNDEGLCCIPAKHIYAALVRAGGAFQYSGRTTFKEIIKAGISIDPELSPIDPQEFEIWACDVVIGNARVVKHRPRWLAGWKAEFIIEVFDKEEISGLRLKEILEMAGKKKGIGDWRPLNGRFIVLEFEEIKKAKVA